MSCVFKNILYVLLGIIIAVGLFALAVGIGCAVNGLTFGGQIAEWFGSAPSVSEEVVEQVSNVAGKIAML